VLDRLCFAQECCPRRAGEVEGPNTDQKSNGSEGPNTDFRRRVGTASLQDVALLIRVGAF
jgi:hypothetical protein